MPSPITLAARLLDALPHTQCTRCGYPDCAAYAAAMAHEAAPINQCPPGGAEGVARLAAITGQAVVPLNPANGREAPRAVAVIDEAWCIGCTLCIDACPTDAILGASKFMHTVIEPYCTGCELCLPVCPVDCIAMDIVSGTSTGWQAWSSEQAENARRRYEFRSNRSNIHRSKQPISSKISAQHESADPNASLPRVPTPSLDAEAAFPSVTAGESTASNRKRAVIEAALARARAKASGD